MRLLKQQIEALGVRCGFPLTGVFVMDGSKRSTKANAFFTGLGKQKKIALFDTLVEKSSQPELLGVLAHEIGHFRCGHIKQRLAVGILQMAVIFFLLGLATDPEGKFARLLFNAFGVKQISPHVGLVLFSILLEPVSKVLGILANAWSRRHEFEAGICARNHRRCWPNESGMAWSRGTGVIGGISWRSAPVIACASSYNTG